MFERLRKWLSGTFICRMCGRSINLMTFGYGECICPECYNGEEKTVFFDTGYWLNRLLDRLQ